MSNEAEILYGINDTLTALNNEFGNHADDDALNELTHHVAQALGAVPPTNEETRQVAAKDLDTTMVLVGNSGGRSAVVGYVEPSNLMMGCLSVETEHGTLYIEPDEMVTVQVR